jgi:hypothetical protein
LGGNQKGVNSRQRIEEVVCGDLLRVVRSVSGAENWKFMFSYRVLKKRLLLNGENYEKLKINNFVCDACGARIRRPINGASTAWAFHNKGNESQHVTDWRRVLLGFHNYQHYR